MIDFCQFLESIPDLRELVNDATLLRNLQLEELHFLFLVGMAQVCQRAWALQLGLNALLLWGGPRGGGFFLLRGAEERGKMMVPQKIVPCSSCK